MYVHLSIHPYLRALPIRLLQHQKVPFFVQPYVPTYLPTLYMYSLSKGVSEEERTSLSCPLPPFLHPHKSLSIAVSNPPYLYLFLSIPLSPPPSPLPKPNQKPPLTSPTLDLLRTTLLHPQLALRNRPLLLTKAFSRLWLLISPLFASDIPTSLTALLATCHGTILDIGPGSGEQVHRFPAASSDQVKVIYGVEPATDLHPALRQKVRAAGLEGRYRILGCGAQEGSLVPALVRAGVLSPDGAGAGAGEGKDGHGHGHGPFDEVVCVRVLCGVPDLTATVAGLYALLKPGGRMVVFEHVVNSGSGRHGKQKTSGNGNEVAARLQRLYMWLGWPVFTGGCELTRDTRRAVEEAARKDGGWAECHLAMLDEWSVVPHVVGYCVKKK